MAQHLTDINTVAKALAKQIRDAAQPQLTETRLSKTAASVSHRERVIEKLAAIDTYLRQFGASDRAKIERALGSQFGVERELAQILKEASIQALTNLGTHWMQFFSALGI